ncbi:MAG TPA: glycosyltransferase [Candidatus Woesebacteria bacterium]|nr:glycosyltransferase [Candidatus Woesebacteria bacterium]
MFVTVGTTQFPFIRLYKILDKLLVETNSLSQVIIQGRMEYKWQYKNIEMYRELSPSDFITIIKQADKIIIHGGFGTMHTVAQNTSIMPLIIARQVEFKEHIDNHQVKFIEYCKEKISEEYKQYFITEEKLGTAISEYLSNSTPKNILSKDIFNSQTRDQLLQKLQKYIDD